MFIYIEETPFSLVPVVLLFSTLLTKLVGLIDMVNVRSENSMAMLRGRCKSCTVGYFVARGTAFDPGANGISSMFPGEQIFLKN